MRSRSIGIEVKALVACFLSIALCVGSTRIAAQQEKSEPAFNSEVASQSTDRWQVGGFAAGGFPPYYTVHAPLLRYGEELLFYSAGLEAGRIITTMHGPKILRGKGEAVAELIPYWQVNHPAQTVQAYPPGSSHGFSANVGGYSVHGASITPFQFRWNFEKKDTTRFVPWIQPGFGFLWTNQTFPQGYGDAAVPPIVRTSHFNFTPQVSFGQNVFVRRRQSLTLSLQAVHITNFGLTTYDPGVNVIIQFRAGYSWWR